MSSSYNSIEKLIVEALGGRSLDCLEKIQTLWSGYGEILRYRVRDTLGMDSKTVIVKHVTVPTSLDHPRGWNTSASHQRKIRSYQVEAFWYQQYSVQCNERCRVPVAFFINMQDDEFLFVLEDLDAAGFPKRILESSLSEVKLCLRWLAHFHATFMVDNSLGRASRGALDGRRDVASGLWPVGSYWHLATRRDEYNALAHPRLKSAAIGIDQKLNSTQFHTLIHGDAKLANFCFSSDSGAVAAVDFQYVGGGCGMKDLALLMSSCFDSVACYRHEEALLDYYFHELKMALSERNLDLDWDALENEWRGLYCFAWADFVRFLKGWSPGHWKLHDYSETMAERAICALAKEP